MSARKKQNVYSFKKIQKKYLIPLRKKFNILENTTLYYYVMAIILISVNTHTTLESIEHVNKIYAKIKELVPKEEGSIFKIITAVLTGIKQRGLIIDTLEIPVKLYMINSILNDISNIHSLSGSKLRSNVLEKIVQLKIDNFIKKMNSKNVIIYNMSLHAAYNVMANLVDSVTKI